jgi:hypothetical protein
VVEQPGVVQSDGVVAQREDAGWFGPGPRFRVHDLGEIAGQSTSNGFT